MAKKIKTKFCKIVLYYLLLQFVFANLAFADQPPPTIVDLELMEVPTKIVVCYDVGDVTNLCPETIAGWPNIYFFNGEVKQLSAWAYYESSGNYHDITYLPWTVWSIENCGGGGALVDTDVPVHDPIRPGVVTATSVGTTCVRAAYGVLQGINKVGDAYIVVENPTSIDVTPNPASIIYLENGQFKAEANFPSGRTVDVTNFPDAFTDAVTTWSAEYPVILEVNDTDHKGLAKGLTKGISKIYAAFSGQTGNADVTVRQDTPDSITVNPSNGTIERGGHQQYTATAHFSDGSSLDISDSAVWNSSNPVIADFNIADPKGLITGLTAGLVSISATYSGITSVPSALLTVSEVLPISILVDPSSAGIYIGRTQYFQAYLVYSGGVRGANITADSSAFWSSSFPGIATVGEHDGLAYGATEGTVTISVTYGGLTGTATLTSEIYQAPPSGGGVPPLPPEPETPPPTPTPEPETPPPTPTPEPETPPPTPTPEPETPPPTPTPEPETPPPTPTPEPETPPPTPTPEPETPPPTPTPEPETPTPTPETPTPTPEPETPTPTPEPETPTPNTIPPEQKFSPIPPPPGEELLYTVPGLENAIVNEVAPPMIDPELAVSRGQMMAYIIQKFKLESRKVDLLRACKNDLNGCLSIFLSVTKFNDVIVNGKKVFVGFIEMLNKAHAQESIDLSSLQLYPDVSPENPYVHYINVASLLGIVQGYYEEPLSPFKPDKIITRIEATKVLLGSTDMLKWLYYDELETRLGGIESIKAQKTLFADVAPSRDYMWWYPRYINKGCEVKMFVCIPGSSFRPDEYVTKEEVQQMLNNLETYMIGSGYDIDQTSDKDNDGLKSYLEDTVYLTDANNPDTDGDGLLDGEEVLTYTTNPFLTDSDADGIGDYDEVKKYMTDPLNTDTDSDGFPDNVEILASTDPVDAASYPANTTYKGVSNKWQEDNKISVEDGAQDTDGDGVPDVIEYQLSTDPISADSDKDGYTDGVEIYDLGTNPNVPNTPAEIEEILRISNLKEGQLIGTSKPLIKGVAPLGSTVRIILRDDFSHEKVLGDTTVDDNHIFIFQVQKPIRDGRYMIIARALQLSKQSVKESAPVHIIIDSTLNVAAPIPQKIADTPITSDVLLQNLRVEIKDRRPVVYGLTDFGNKVTANWRSVVTTSSLIADSLGGEFAIMAPNDLGLGEHEVYVSAVRKKDNAQSDTVKVLFQINPSFEEPLGTVQLKGAVEENLAKFLPVTVVKFVTRNWILVVIIGFVLAAVGGLSIYLFLGERKKR